MKYILALGFAGAIFFGFVMRTLAQVGTGNLPSADQAFVEFVMLIVGVAAGALAGAVIGHRHVGRHVLFGAMAGAVTAALCGFAFAIVMDAEYLRTYGGAPSGVFDGLLVALSYPVFGLLGAFLGALPGAVFGTLAGAVSRR